MKRASLGFAFAVVLLAFPAVSRAADPAGQEQTDPFAPTDTKAPSVEDQEAAVLGAPAKAAPPAPPPAPRPTAPARRQREDDEGRSSKVVAKDGEKVADQTGVAIELSTTGFASGALDGGLFIGGRTASGMVLGGFLDYALTSVTVTPSGGPELSNSMQLMRLGAGVRLPFLQTADRRAELYGVGDVSFDYKSAEVISTSGSMPTDSLSASGFSLALGPGVRLWVHDQVAIGYVARFRLSFLSGAAGVFTPIPTDDTTDGKLTQIGFDGVFQILAIF
jgi:hypothetical protein